MMQVKASSSKDGAVGATEDGGGATEGATGVADEVEGTPGPALAVGVEEEEGATKREVMGMPLTLWATPV